MSTFSSEVVFHYKKILTFQKYVKKIKLIENNILFSPLHFIQIDFEKGYNFKIRTLNKLLCFILI